MTIPPPTTSAAHCAAILSLATKAPRPVKPATPVLATRRAKTVSETLTTLLPAGTQVAHNATSLPLPPMFVSVGYERTGLPVAMLSADAGLTAALIAHQCGMKVDMAQTEPGQFETGFLANLATRLLPALFQNTGNVAVVREIDDLTQQDGPDTHLTDTLFVATIPDKPQNRTGRLRLLTPAPNNARRDGRSDSIARTTPIAASCRLNLRPMSLQQVADLEEGSLLTLEPATKAVLTINGKSFAEGMVQEQAGKRSFHIATPETGVRP